jgi:hypothetical protein
MLAVRIDAIKQSLQSKTKKFHRALHEANGCLQKFRRPALSGELAQGVAEIARGSLDPIGCGVQRVDLFR